MEALFARVAVVGAEVKTYYVEEGTTVHEVLDMAGVEVLVEGPDVERPTDIRIQNRLINPSDVVQDGDIIVIVEGIKGGYMSARR